MWNQWPVAAVPAAPMSAPPQPSVPPPLPDAPPPPPPSENTLATTATEAVAAGVPGVGNAATGYMAPVGTQSASNPYEQYTAAQYAAMTPEQQYALQQHWQQWQTYQQDYAKWHAQYGEQYKREMAAAAAAATTTTVPIVAPVPVAAPVTATVPTMATIYPQAQLAQQITVQPQMQAYFPQPKQPQPQTQSQLSGKIMAQPQMYNQPPPPPPQGYQQHPQQQQQPQQMQRQQQPPPSNQWQQQQQPTPGRFNQVPPVNYNQAPHPGDPSMFPNIQQPPPAFMQQPPLSANQIDAPWAKDQNKSKNDRGNINEANQRRHGWDGPPLDGGRQQQHQQQQGPPPNNRWQSNEQGNNKNKSANKSNQFGNRRNWQNNPPGNNNKNSNNRNNPFSSAAPNHYGSDSGDAADPGDPGCNSNSSGGIDGRSYSINSFSNNGSGQRPADNFGSGSFDNNCRSGNNNNNARWEHNRQNQGGVNFGPSHDSNNDCGGYNQVHNRNNFNQQQQQQQQRAPDLDEASFDRLFDQWEKQFEDWKRANANHPDRDEYRRYEEEFEKQRRRIAERREQMRRRRQLQNPQQNQQQANQQPYPKAEQQHQGQQGVNFRTGYDNYEEQHNRGNTPNNVNIDQTNKRISDATLENQHVLPITLEEKEAHHSDAKKEQEKVGAKLAQPSQQSSQKQKHQQGTRSPKSETPTPSTTSRNQQKQPHQEVENSKCTANILGKRKTDQRGNVGATSTPAKTAKEDNILIISLDDDDDDDDADYVQKSQIEKEDDSAAYTPMKNIFKKSDGIPGLDLVADGQAAVPPAAVSAASRATDAPSADNNKKIPSLFDVVIDKPVSESEKDPVATNPTISETLPDDVSNALKDPEFMNNLSQALAQAQGRDRDQLQQQQQSNEPSKHCSNNNSNNNNNDRNNDGRPMSFAEWQRKKNNRESDQQDEPFRNLSSFRPGSGNEPGPGGGFGPDQRQQQRYGPNGPALMHGAGPGDSQLMGPNFIDFSGPSSGNPCSKVSPSGPNFGAPNFDRQGSGNGPGPGHGPTPGPFGGGSGFNGPFGRNFGPGGPNNSNFLGPGPNFNDRGPNFGPNFHGNGPGPGLFRPNFCVSSGPASGPNFGGPVPFCGPGSNNANVRNFGQGPNNPNEHNFGLGPNNPNERNFGSGPHNPNFIGPNMSNNKSNSFIDNPFRRNGGPPAPNFDSKSRDGPGFEERVKGQIRNNFGNVGHNNKPWADRMIMRITRSLLSRMLSMLASKRRTATAPMLSTIAAF
ncbi:transcription factor mef2A isoform X3 [Drosophila innubila]|uniref:transcription factor mef2A isoform X3 n=1 Tax=Drosophila innubila TaxID=198719 RepID=UPI00148E5135|nr:transcription factor mef2A isoform X3 [Drosophila innubila]